MTRFTRRSVLAGSATAAIGLSARQSPAFTPSPPPYVVQRVSVSGLPVYHPVLQSFRTAVQAMRDLDNTDKRSWTNIMLVHHQAPHGNWYFLPWHRAYLASFERICRQLSGDDNFRIPYWDWTANRRIPGAFGPARPPFGPNPLYDPTRQPATDSLPDDQVGSAKMSMIIGEPNFEMFMSTRPTGITSIDPKWQNVPGYRGKLEMGPHDFVHNWVGGHMADIHISPLDPLFWAHHANLDRIWDLWTRQPGHTNTADPLWHKFRFLGQFINSDKTSWEPLVSDLVNTNQLGYSYFPTFPSPEPFVALLAEPTMFSQFDWNRTVRSLAQIAGPAIATTEEPLSVVLRSPLPVPQLFNKVLRLASPESNAVAGRAIALITADPPTNSLSPEVRVFLNCDYLSPATPAYDPHYVDSFVFFGGGHDAHPGHGHAGPAGALRFALDLTPTLLALQDAGLSPTDQLVLQLQPVAIGTGQAAPVKIQSVELVVT
jgi:tyrosinase